MKVKIVYSDQCPHCIDLLNKLKAQEGIPDMEIEYVELGSAEAAEIIKSNNINDIPAVVSETNVSCKVEYFNSKVEIICPD